MKSFKQLLNEGNKALDSKGKELKVGDKITISKSSTSDYAGETAKIWEIIRHKSASDTMSVRLLMTDRKNLKVQSPVPANQTTKV
jgi:hypothetical protein